MATEIRVIFSKGTIGEDAISSTESV